MTNQPDPSDSGNTLEDSFASILLGDVVSAISRHDASQSQQHRRELIRSVFAGIEGLTWLYRTHIVDAAKSLDKLDLDEEMALSELSGVGER